MHDFDTIRFQMMSLQFFCENCGEMFARSGDSDSARFCSDLDCVAIRAIVNVDDIDLDKLSLND